MIPSLSSLKGDSIAAHTPAPIRLKAGLLCHGIKASEKVRKLYAWQNPHDDRKTGNVGLHLELPGPTHVLATLSHHFNLDSPFSLEGECGDWRVTGLVNGPIPIKPVEMKSWYQLLTSSGRYMASVLLHEGQSYLHQEYAGCDYFSDGIQCQFCGAGKEWKIATPEEVAETVAAALRTCPEYHVCLGGGTRMPLQRNVAYFLECVRLIRRNNPTVPIWVEMAPPEISDIGRLIDAGATSFGFNLEFWNQNLRKHFCPGKSSIAKQHYLDAFAFVADRLGPNRVGSCLIVGLEPEESSIEGAEQLCRLGVQPCILPFKPWNGSVLNQEKQCSPEMLLRVSYAAATAMHRSRIIPNHNQGCLKCEGCTIDHDMLALVESSRI
jgi:hypothetical protein